MIDMDEKAPSKSVVLRSFVPSLVLKAQIMLKFNSKEQFLDNYLATLSPSRDLYQKDSLSKQKTRHVFTSTTLKIFH